MNDMLIELLERAFVEQEVDPLARGHLAGGVLPRDALCTAARFRAPLTLAQAFKFRGGLLRLLR